MVVRLESQRYLADIGFFDNLELKHSVPIAAYILCSHVALPVKTIIVGERPYSTDIHPSVSSAMSYDQSKSRSTPSTSGVARDLCSTVGATYLESERWFRDSWMYLNSGVVLVNCCVYVDYSSPHSIVETVAFQRWIRSIIDCSTAVSMEKINIVCMGVPAINVINGMINSMGSTALAVSKKDYPNPAVFSRTRTGDSASLTHTFGKKETSEVIYNAIKRSRLFVPLSFSDYASEVHYTMTSQVPQVDRVMEAANDLASEIESAFKELEGNHKMPTLKESVNAFNRALLEYRDAVLRDLVAHHVASMDDGSRKIGKATEWGSKKPWKKAPSSVAQSGKMSVVSEDTGGARVDFVDDEVVPVNFIDDDVQPEPTETKKKKKKTVMRPVKKVHAKEQGDTEDQGETKVGNSISEDKLSVLRHVLYYIGDAFEKDPAALTEAVADSINKNLVLNGDVKLILDTVAEDYRSTGTTVSKSLGLDDGAVSEECMLPRLLQRLVDLRG